MNTTRHALLAELSARSPIIAAMNLVNLMQDEPLDAEVYSFANTPKDLDKVAESVELLVKDQKFSLANAEVAIRSLVNPRNFYGQYCELSVYGWLSRNSVRYTAQVDLTSSDVLKVNGSTIDGEFSFVEAYFDIKAMGFQEYVAEQFRKGLADLLPGLTITIDGSMDVSVKDIQQHAFPQISMLAKKLAAGGTELIAALNWSVKASPPSPISMSTRTTDPYRLAEENRFYPFKTAGQFAKNRPFVMIFGAAAQFNRSLSWNFGGSTEITFRALARRAFMQHTNDSTPASAFDPSVPQGVTLGDASRLLSAILFINLDSDESWLYLNPRASHRFQEHHVHQIFDFMPPVNMTMDDFMSDNY